MNGELISSNPVIAALEAKLLYDVCGPTAKYVGNGLASYTEAGINNLKRVFSIAAERLKALGKSDGQVPPRLLKDILMEGYFCEDELGAQYLGGILASGKGPVSRDDRAVSHCALIASLSSYQLRTHYLLYSAILTLNEDRVAEILRWVRRGDGTTVLINAVEYIEAMEFAANEDQRILPEHAFIGLQQKGLVEEGLAVINPNSNIRSMPREHFRFFRPTTSGIELFLWGLGVGDRGFSAYGPQLLCADLPRPIKPIHVELGRCSYS